MWKGQHRCKAARKWMVESRFVLFFKPSKTYCGSLPASLRGDIRSKPQNLKKYIDLITT